MREITFGKAINEALNSEMEKDSNVILFGENVTSQWREATKGLKEKFGRERVRDAPITETSFIGAGVGAAIVGLKPVVELMLVDFGLVAMDQILNQMAKSTYMSGGAVNVPMTLRVLTGAGTSSGATHSESLHGLFAHMPGLKVVVPSNPYDAKGLLISSIRDDNPKIFMEHRLLYPLKGHVPEESYSIPLGIANVVQEGDDVTVVATGYMVQEALKSAEIADKVSVEIIDPRTLVPFDESSLIKSIRKTGRLIVVDEDYKFSGFSGEVVAIAAEKVLDKLVKPPIRVCTPNVPIPYNPNLEKFLLPNKDKISRAIIDLAK
jgi:pyruvate dehydrogenase E1 component beta subunit